MIDGIDETLGAEAIEGGNDVRLDRQHVWRSKFLTRIQQLVDALGAKRRHPLDAQRIEIAVGRHPAIRSRDHPRRRIVDAGQLVVRHIPGPLVRVVVAGYRNGAVSRRANRNQSSSLVADMSIDIGVDNVLRGRTELRKSRFEVLPVLRRVDGKERNMRSPRIIDRPLQRELAALARHQIADDRPVPRHHDIDSLLRAAFDANDFLAMPGLHPSLRR